VRTVYVIFFVESTPHIQIQLNGS